MHLTLQHFFDASSVNFHAFGGWMVSLSNIINAFAASLYLMFVVCSQIFYLLVYLKVVIVPVSQAAVESAC